MRCESLIHLEEDWIEHVLILSGDQLYRMDFSDMMRTHIESGAHATIAGIPVSRDDASSLGIMQVMMRAKSEALWRNRRRKKSLRRFGWTGS